MIVKQMEDQPKNTIPRARTIGDVISGHAHT